MPKYYFEARTFAGEIKKGQIEAKDISELAKILKDQGLFLIRANKEKEKKRWFKVPSISFGISLADKMFFTRNLKVMIAAGLPLTKALPTLANQVKSKTFKKAILDINERVEKGESLSQALSLFPKIFPEIYQNMVKVGEESGRLEEVLEILAIQLEREHELKSKVKGAMIYPAVVISAMIGIGILMLVMVVPKLAETFEELEVELPATTKFVIFLGNFLAQNFLILFFSLILFFFFLSQFLKTERGKRIFDNLIFKIPIISEISKKQNSALFTRTLSSLISAGVSLPRALEITASTLGNIFFKEALLKGAERVKKGEKLSQTLKNYQSFIPLTVISMIEVGEETGETAQILEKLADFYESEVTNATKNLASVVEPILLLLIGGAVGFFAFSMVQPMYSMLQAIK
jgi:type IV pilus assembly protein PilC